MPPTKSRSAAPLDSSVMRTALLKTQKIPARGKKSACKKLPTQKFAYIYFLLYAQKSRVYSIVLYYIYVVKVWSKKNCVICR